MNKIIRALCLTAILTVGVFAQNDVDEPRRNEFYVGYSYQSVDNFDRAPFNGVEGSYVRNVHRYFGVKGDVSAAFRNENFSTPLVFSPTGNVIRGENNRSLYNVLGGVQIKDNAGNARFKPFAHALAGIAHFRYKTKNITCDAGCPSFATDDFEFTETGFSAAFGGGLDIKINDKVDFRLIQVDYNPIRASGQWNNNVRFGIGFVFK